MIAYLKGVAVSEDVIVDSCGVGRQVLSDREFVSGECVELWIVTEIRENSWNLYGFSSLDLKEAFCVLRKVQGVSGKLAMSILTHLGVDGLYRCLQQQDAKALTSVKGVGPKLASVVVTTATLPQSYTQGGSGESVLRALLSLGYGPREASQAVSQTFSPDATEQANISAALLAVSRGE